MSQHRESTSETIDRWLAAGEISSDPDELLIKRAYPRLPIADEFVIRSLESPNEPEHFVKGYNISPTGLGVISKHPIEAESQVQIQGEASDASDPWVTGKIVHCTMTVGGFKIGIEFDSEIEIEYSQS